MNAKRRWWKRPALFALLAVVLVALGVTYAALARARERARRRMCCSCLRNCIAYACGLFAEDYGGHYPPTLGVLYPAYVPDGHVFLCPSAGKATALEDDPRFSLDRQRHVKNYTPAMFGDTHTDYVWVSGLKATDPPHYILAFDDEWNHDGEGVTVLRAGLGPTHSESGWIRDIKALHDQLARQEKELAAQGRKMTIHRPAWSSWPDPPAGGDPPGEARPDSEARREERWREVEAEMKRLSSERAAREAAEERAAEERRRRHAEHVARLAAEDRRNVQQALLALGRDLPRTLTLDLGGGVAMELVLVPAGEFLMGDPRWDGRLDSDNGPQHRVRITRPFYMGKYEVTQAQYERIVWGKPSMFRGANLPADRVSWSDATEFCRKLSKRTGKTVRLPTEAEWEYACRAGTTTSLSFGDDWRLLDDHAWHEENAHRRSHPVGTKRPNAWGLHDMYGNVWEWCSDWYDPGYYARSPEEDPQGPASRPRQGSWVGFHVTRGGSWNYVRSGSAGRNPYPPVRGSGFRVVAAVPGQ